MPVDRDARSHSPTTRKTTVTIPTKMSTTTTRVTVDALGHVFSLNLGPSPDPDPNLAIHHVPGHNNPDPDPDPGPDRSPVRNDGTRPKQTDTDK
jgi:hypothetical protein